MPKEITYESLTPAEKKIADDLAKGSNCNPPLACPYCPNGGACGSPWSKDQIASTEPTVN